jgi:hypothetical protein
LEMVTQSLLHHRRNANNALVIEPTAGVTQLPHLVLLVKDEDAPSRGVVEAAARQCQVSHRIIATR